MKKTVIMWLIKKFLPGYKLTADIPDLPGVAEWIKCSSDRDMLMKQMIGRVYGWQRHLSKNPPKGGKRNPRADRAAQLYKVAGE